MAPSPRKPPPLPPAGRPHPATRPGERAAPEQPRSLPPDAPRRVGEHVSQALKDHITEMALGLLEEQMQARIVHYRADLATNPELDAVTAQVVAQLKVIQASASPAERGAKSRDVIQSAHEKTLATLLERVIREDGVSLLVERRLKKIHKNLARLFFQSELHEKTQGRDGAAKVIHHGEQALFYVLTRYRNRIESELDGFEFASEEVRAQSFELLAKLTKDLQDAFLARRSSELRRIVSVVHTVLVDFFSVRLAPSLGDIAARVVRDARTFEGKAYAYKVTSDAFPRFRAAFERHLMVTLVGFAEDELVAQLADTAGSERDETILFITDPHLFSMICGEVCEGLYEFLCNEGFLDLPPDWRRASTAPSDS
ncbi:hypothetical protein SOCE26_047180 [Sorangium cellulosum]|uniref:Uncharacterized protein n=1 Tax=Sorangium cellulosum TaxID=56 RepID=A0A2L0EVE8_SORCE|nr:hypothetical protein [Sorangium cellulosum]AUX43274.1 hypothetical protein SOCE26_047180 [Sorangium cellulosum]